MVNRWKESESINTWADHKMHHRPSECVTELLCTFYKFLLDFLGIIYYLIDGPRAQDHLVCPGEQGSVSPQTVAHYIIKDVFTLVLRVYNDSSVNHDTYNNVVSVTILDSTRCAFCSADGQNITTNIINVGNRIEVSV